MKNVFLAFLLLLVTMLATPVKAASHLWTKGQSVVLNYRIDFSKSDLVAGVANGAVGAHVLGNLPDDFIITDVIVNPVLALTGGGTMVVGEDGGGDADGYCLNLDAVTIDVASRCIGALIYTAPATAGEIGTELPYKVLPAKDGFTITIATTAYTAGILEFIVIGYQGE